MSSGVSSGQSAGVGESQLTIENFEYENKINELFEEIAVGDFTESQRITLNRLFNTIIDHLTDKDYSGVERDLNGDPVPNGKGGYFNHLNEMRDAYKALDKSRRSIEGSLQNPNLGDHERGLLEFGLGKANEHIGKIKKLFEAYGGVDKWIEE